MIAQNRKLATINDSTLIVAVDIASQKHVARAINWRGHILGEPLIFDNRLEGFEGFLKWIRQLQAKHGLVDVVVGMEPTGHYWLNLAAYLRACDVPVVLVNPFHVKQTKEFVDNSPTKNDRKDALVIGKLIKDGHFVIPTWPQGDFAELRGLVHLRYQLMKNLQRLHARIRRWLDQYFPEFLDVFPDWESKTALVSLRLFPLPQDVCAYTPDELVRQWREHGVQRAVGLSRARSLRASAERSIGLTQGLHAARLSLHCWLQEYDLLRQQLEEIEQAIAELLKRIPGAMEMLSIPGVSEMTVAGFLAETGDLRQYRDWRQIRKLAGLNIVENRSGKHASKTRISKRGRARLRALLYRCVFVLVAKNAEFRALHRYYTKERPNPLKPKQSLVALCCRLIRLLYVLGTRKIRYDASRMPQPPQSIATVGLVA